MSSTMDIALDALLGRAIQPGAAPQPVSSILRDSPRGSAGDEGAAQALRGGGAKKSVRGTEYGGRPHGTMNGCGMKGEPPQCIPPVPGCAP
mmetsp:Transcript_8944/g.21234  ORF Transcript_8944/g.21234 Transcript_8944/m.21234 type:complete len:91 (-) Transcript_8944:471-743(-)